MAQTYATEAAPLGETPAAKVEGNIQGARERVYRATITLASQASADTIVLAKAEAGLRFSHGRMATSASLSTATLAIGTAASSGKYRTAATFTATDTPTAFGNVTTGINAARLTAEETVIATVGTAALPASGTLVIELIYVAA
jgi:hypothetical protein